MLFDYQTQRINCCTFRGRRSLPSPKGAIQVLKPCNHNLRRALSLVEEMIDLADQGDADREDVGCGVLYGIIRDSAYKIQKMAQEEKRRHQEKGWWASES
jgi:hypothetical protein